MRKILFFFIFIQLHLSYAQIDQLHQQKIQKLWEESDFYLFKDIVKSIQFAKDATVLSEKYGDSFNKAKSYLILGRSLLNAKMHQESLSYLSKGLEEPAVEDEFFLKVYFKEIKSDNYGQMGLIEQEFQEYSDILALTPEDQSSRDYQRVISRIHARMANNLLKRADLEQANYYINKSVKIQEQLAEGELYNVYLVKGDILLHRKQYDSAFYYFDKSYQMVDKGVEIEYFSLKSFGDYYKQTKNPFKAIDFYEQALNNMEKFNAEESVEKIEIYKSLIQLAKETDDLQRKNKYLQLYQSDSEKLQSKNNDDVQAAIKSILNEEQQEKSLLKKQSLYTIVSIIIIFSIVLIVFYIQYRKIRKRKKELRFKFDKILLELEKRKKIESEKDKGSISIEKKEINTKNTRQKLISDDKEAELLLKLEDFEKGTAFTEKSFTQANLAAILETNAKYLSYILKEHRNKSFNDYINGLKINFIVYKLYNHPEYLNYKISYLSDISGFSSQSRFTYIFKQELDMSPSEFITQLSEKSTQA